MARKLSANDQLRPAFMSLAASLSVDNLARRAKLARRLKNPLSSQLSQAQSGSLKSTVSRRCPSEEVSVPSVRRWRPVETLDWSARVVAPPPSSGLTLGRRVTRLAHAQTRRAGRGARVE